MINVSECLFLKTTVASNANVSVKYLHIEVTKQRLEYVLKK